MLLKAILFLSQTPRPLLPFQRVRLLYHALRHHSDGRSQTREILSLLS